MQQEEAARILSLIKDITGRKTNVKQKQLLQSVWGWYLSWRLLVFLGDGFNIWVLQQWGVIRWSPVSKISFLGYCHLANSFWEIEQGRMVLLHKRWPLFTECHVHKEEQGSQAASHLKHVTAMKTGLKKKKKKNAKFAWIKYIPLSSCVVIVCLTDHCLSGEPSGL